MLKKYLFGAAFLLVASLPKIVNFIGLGGVPGDLGTWGQWMTSLGFANFASLVFLAFGAGLFVDEIRQRRAANPYHLLHQIFRRKKWQNYLGRMQWSDFSNVLCFQSPPRRVVAVELSGQNWRSNAVKIHSVQIVAQNVKSSGQVNGLDVPKEGVRIREWGHFKVRCEVGELDVRQFAGRWSEFDLVLETDKGEFVVHFSRPEIQAILFREVVGSWEI